MKEKMKPIIVLMILLISIVSGCVSSEPSVSQTEVIKTDLNTAVTPPTFDWKTSQSISVNIVGLPTIDPVRKTLKIYGSSGTYYTALYLMSDTSKIAIETPSGEKELNLKFGTLELKSAILNGEANFSFVPDTTSTY